jgi:steroid 5-alpha reductase family enzyme
VAELRTAFTGLGVVVAGAVLAWLFSLVRHDVSVVDSLWSLFITTAGIVYALMLPSSNGRAVLMLALAVVWALRLSIYISWRNHGQPEDRRYQQIRARNQPNFELKSLYLIFVLQALLAWIVSAPFLAGVSGQNPLNALDFVGAALAAFGIVFEAVGDQQMARFKRDPAHQGQVMDRGLWRYTRHPNYFGECCTWWGLYLIALAAGGAWWSIVSPLLMTFLLLKVSGVSLLEADITERRPAYRDYIARTSAFIPAWPRRKESV